jgi:hypothetical protein
LNIVLDHSEINYNLAFLGIMKVFDRSGHLFSHIYLYFIEYIYHLYCLTLIWEICIHAYIHTLNSMDFVAIHEFLSCKIISLHTYNVHFYCYSEVEYPLCVYLAFSSSYPLSSFSLSFQLSYIFILYYFTF